MAKRGDNTVNPRKASLTRKTKETEIALSLNLDGSGNAKIQTGIGFFDHMLDALTKHGALDLELSCKGDLHIDAHHSVEDVGIALGQALHQALGNKSGIQRFGFASVPLDEALSQVTVDFAGRGFFAIRGAETLGQGSIGEFDVELLEDFLGALAASAQCTLHLEIRAGRNKHHMVESAFKALARAIRQAVSCDPGMIGIPSTKGVL